MGCVATPWLSFSVGGYRQCHLTSTEYATLLSWLPPCLLVQPGRVGKPPPEPNAGVISTKTSLGSIPLCMAEIVTGQLGHNQVVLQSLPSRGVALVAVSAISDPAVAVILRQHLAVFPLLLNGHEASLVECLALLRRAIEKNPFQQEYITVSLFHAPEAPLAAISWALVRDWLLGNGREN
jgi:hypothetical protein